MKYETNCERISESLISYLDWRANAAEQREVEAHAVVCSACKTRIEEFRRLSVVLDELPGMQPSGAFDAHVRQRIAGEPRARWFGWLDSRADAWRFRSPPCCALSVWTASLEPRVPEAPTSTAQSEQDFRSSRISTCSRITTWSRISTRFRNCLPRCRRAAGPGAAGSTASLKIKTDTFG